MPQNRLAKEKSPYLLQHSDNPVDWYPWGEAAFQKAQKEDKPIFLSIGYSTCHWCHVMEHESFENPEIAKILNEHFVSIKVDREERPDIDHAYMSVVVAMTGSGGWPLSAFLAPDKKPFFGGTYFPPEAKWGAPGFKDLLLSISDTWKNRREEILQSGRSILDILQNQDAKKKSESPALDRKTLDLAYRQLTQMFDSRNGGFGEQPKFPTSHNLSFLLRYGKRAGEQNAFSMAEKTLLAMAEGGIHDHLGGGFHRYSTDEKWHVPHFEKMLYDQAILTRTYLEAYQVTQKPFYIEVAKDIFDYVLRDMQYPQGGFFSAEDADSTPPDADLKDHPEKKEGAFFLWGAEEISQVLGKDDADIFNYHFGVEPAGNAAFDPHGEFIGKNILYVAHSLKGTANHFKKSASDVEMTLRRSKEKLFQQRTKRPKPHLDDKILTDWNGLMISSLAFGSRVLHEPRYLKGAEDAAQFILKNLIKKDGRLLHRFRDGEAAILGTISDYAFFICGLLDLYEASFKIEYLREAKRLAKDMVRFFWDDGPGGFFFSASDAEKILFKQKDIYDGAIPSGNSMAALNLIRLSRLTLEDDWEKKAGKLFDAFSSEVAQRPSGYAQMLIALDFALGPSQEIVLVGDAKDKMTQEMIKAIFAPFLPNKVVAFRPFLEKEAQPIFNLVPFLKEQSAIGLRPTVYICENYVCKLPTNDLHKLKELLNKTIK